MEKTVTLKPLPDVDFDFYIEFDGNVCPTITSKVTLLNGCQFGVFYTGTNAVIFGSQPVTFVNNTATVTVSYGNYQIETDGKACLALACDRTTSVTQIVLTTPNFQVVSPDVLSLAGKIQLAENFNQTLNSIDSIKAEINDSITKINSYAALLKTINFTSVVTDNPFANFSALRADVEALLAQMNSNNGTQAPQTSGCTGVFASAACFFEQAANTLIAVAVCIGVLIIVYCILKHTKCKKNLPGQKKYHKEEGQRLEVVVDIEDGEGDVVEEVVEILKISDEEED